MQLFARHLQLCVVKLFMHARSVFICGEKQSNGVNLIICFITDGCVVFFLPESVHFCLYFVLLKIYICRIKGLVSYTKVTDAAVQWFSDGLPFGTQCSILPCTVTYIVN